MLCSVLTCEEIHLMSKTDQRVNDDSVYSSEIYGFVVRKNVNKTISIL